jgi:hypothetical protein
MNDREWDLWRQWIAGSVSVGCLGLSVPQMHADGLRWPRPVRAVFENGLWAVLPHPHDDTGAHERNGGPPRMGVTMATSTSVASFYGRPAPERAQVTISDDGWVTAILPPEPAIVVRAHFPGLTSAST